MVRLSWWKSACAFVRDRSISVRGGKTWAHVKSSRNTSRSISHSASCSHVERALRNQRASSPGSNSSQHCLIWTGRDIHKYSSSSWLWLCARTPTGPHCSWAVYPGVAWGKPGSPSWFSWALSCAVTCSDFAFGKVGLWVSSANCHLLFLLWDLAYSAFGSSGSWCWSFFQGECGSLARSPCSDLRLVTADLPRFVPSLRFSWYVWSEWAGVSQ